MGTLHEDQYTFCIISLQFFLEWEMCQTNILQKFYVWVSVHHKLIYIKRTNVMQLGSMFICNCNNALHVSDAFCVHLHEHLETVVAASGE